MSTRSPPDSRPPPYTMVSRVYRSSFRPVVVITGLVTAGWTLVWAIGAFQDINVDKDHAKPKFATLDIVLGSMYMGACVISLFGVIAATMQKLPLVRLYAMLSVLSGLLVVAAGLMRTVTHFAFKNELIDECKQIAQGQDVVFRFGIWGPTVRDKLDATDAQTFCNNAWSHDSFTEIVSLLVEILLAFFFVSVAYTYYRQVLDPTSVANAARAPSAQHRIVANQYDTPAYPQHYNPPYLPYNPPAPIYAPPPGPPPSVGKPPAYEGGEADGYLDGKDKAEDPFADFDGPSHGKLGGESRETLV